MLLSDHIDIITNKAYRNLGFFMRTCKPFKCTISLKVVYYALVRSVLEYASSIWSPIYMKYINQIERIQKKFIKHLNFKCNTSAPSYHDSCRNFNILTLEERRVLMDMGLLHDVLRGRLDCPE